MWILFSVALATRPVTYGTMTPRNGATVPANLTEARTRNSPRPADELPWRVKDGPLLEVLETTVTGKRVRLPALVPGSTISFTGGHHPEGRSPGVTWTITEPAPAPKELGTTVALTTLNGGAHGFVDSAAKASYAQVELVLSDEALPWRDTFYPVLVIDGARFTPHRRRSAYDPRGRLLVPIDCGSSVRSETVEAGEHTFHYEATLLDGTVLQSPKITHTLKCVP